MLQCVAVCCSMLQCVAVCCSDILFEATSCKVFSECDTVRWSVLQCVVVIFLFSGSVLNGHAAVYGSV